MSQLKEWQRKVVLTFKSKKLGATTIIKTFNKQNIDEMKATLATKQICNFNSLSDKPKTIDVTLI